MKIKYVEEIEFCCKDMRALMKSDPVYKPLVEYNKGSVKFNIDLLDGGSIKGAFQYCPFCGEKIELN